MGKLSMLIVVGMLMTLLLGNEGKAMQNGYMQNGNMQVVQTNDVFAWLCQNNQWGSSNFDWCKASSTAAPTVSTSKKPTTAMPVEDTTTQKSSSTTEEDSTTKSTPTTQKDTTSAQSSSTTMNSADSTTSPPTALERAHWCKFVNGSYAALGQTFLYSPCLLCTCSDAKSILCHTLQCKIPYCIDGTKAVIKDGECCSQCVADPVTTCTYGGVTFPQGTIIRSLANNVQCWCQTGGIECRTYVENTTVAATTRATSIYANMDYFGNGTSIYVIVIIICVLLIFVSLLCCGCAIVYYYFYYYQNQQQSAQQAYDQYYTSAGWQPMGEDGQIIDESALAKQAEAEKGHNEENYPTGQSGPYIPPPYNVLNGPYTSVNDGKH